MLTTSNPPPLTIDATPVVRFDHVSKRYHFRDETTLKEFLPGLLRRNDKNAFYALNDVSFDLKRGETLGIIGKNGSGKSTALKLIAGVSSPNKGRVEVNGRVSPLIELGAGFHPDLSGRENIFLNGALLGMSRATVKERWDDIVGFAELWEFMETPLKHFSSGMYMRLGFSLAVHSEPDVLIVDEALAVGDVGFQEKCMERIRAFQRAGVTILLVSHAIHLIEHFCTRVIELDHGRVIADGDPRDVCMGYLQHQHVAVQEAQSLTGTIA